MAPELEEGKLDLRALAVGLVRWPTRMGLGACTGFVPFCAVHFRIQSLLESHLPVSSTEPGFQNSCFTSEYTEAQRGRGWLMSHSRLPHPDTMPCPFPHAG